MTLSGTVSGIVGQKLWGELKRDNEMNWRLEVMVNSRNTSSIITYYSIVANFEESFYVHHFLK